jgi:hypothetical protein
MTMYPAVPKAMMRKISMMVRITFFVNSLKDRPPPV